MHIDFFSFFSFHSTQGMLVWLIAYWLIWKGAPISGQSDFCFKFYDSCLVVENLSPVTCLRTGLLISALEEPTLRHAEGH